jgi:catechol 2,3-dioxygenase-like lactoylglutathione lyase family enzyme
MPPAHLGLRHLALNARALEAMKQFYVDVLGFTVEWEPDPDNVYLTSGRDNLALHRAASGADAPHYGRGAAEASAVETTASASGALDHLGLLVAKAEDVDEWAAFLESRGVTLDAKPRTHRDGARSFYFRDPDGNHVQIIHHPPIAGAL